MFTTWPRSKLLLIVVSLLTFTVHAAALNCGNLMGRAAPYSLKLDTFHELRTADKDKLNFESYQHNLELSRTASSGTSSKSFELPPEQVRQMALDNARDAYQSIKSFADKDSAISEDDLYKFFVSINTRFTTGLNSKTAYGIEAQPGMFRRYVAYENSAPKDIEAMVRREYKDFIHKLYGELKNPNADVYAIAANAHNELAMRMKPFHDGGGRTARAAVDYIFMRKKLALPYYDTSMTLDETNHMSGHYVEAIQDGDKAFADFLRESELTALQRVK